MEKFFMQFSLDTIKQIISFLTFFTLAVVAIGLYLIWKVEERKQLMASIIAFVMVVGLYFTESAVENAFYTTIDKKAITHMVYINGSEVDYNDIDIHLYDVDNISVDDDSYKIMIAID